MQCQGHQSVVPFLGFVLVLTCIKRNLMSWHFVATAAGTSSLLQQVAPLPILFLFHSFPF
uniref:Hypothetical secreted peptide 1061 n=1 Tax=Amblyomma variegatum TaxID=34610 RepID=F0J9S4_AMBVA|nr:TPA_inf: hypothetical secreted peptide precursor 1061 [Amblyomma variegatum]